MYVPELSVLVDRVKPVAILVALTSAFGMSAPCSSFTVPEIEPVICCAFEIETHATSRNIAANHDCTLRDLFQFHFI
jgi:hypothetical protein